jgi:hypothetical protein
MAGANRMDLKFYTIQGCEHPEEERDMNGSD